MWTQWRISGWGQGWAMSHPEMGAQYASICSCSYGIWGAESKVLHYDLKGYVTPPLLGGKTQDLSQFPCEYKAFYFTLK